jgi:hypothetical protein
MDPLINIDSVTVNVSVETTVNVTVDTELITTRKIPALTIGLVVLAIAAAAYLYWVQK